MSKRTATKNFESSLNVIAARAEADKIAQQFGKLLNLSVQIDDLGEDVICSPSYGWLTVNDTDEIKDDRDSRFVFQYSAHNSIGNFTISVIPSDNQIELMTEDGLAIDPSDCSMFEADCPQDGAFKISKWSKFDLSSIA